MLLRILENVSGFSHINGRTEAKLSQCGYYSKELKAQCWSGLPEGVLAPLGSLEEVLWTTSLLKPPHHHLKTADNCAADLKLPREGNPWGKHLACCPICGQWLLGATLLGVLTSSIVGGRCCNIPVFTHPLLNIPILCPPFLLLLSQLYCREINHHL